MEPLYNPQISQDLSNASSLLRSLFGIGSLGLSGIALFITIAGAVVSFLLTVGYYLLQSIPLFIMARKAGCKNAWMAFFPYTNDFLTMTLPAREFNIFNIIKTKRRDVIALIYIALVVAGTLILSILTPIVSFIPVIGPIFSSFGGVILLAVLSIFKWRMYYDLLMTFGQESNALWVSIIALFVPWLFMIFTLFACKNPPEYGKGNYYMCH